MEMIVLLVSKHKLENDSKFVVFRFSCSIRSSIQSSRVCKMVDPYKFPNFLVDINYFMSYCSTVLLTVPVATKATIILEP